MRPPNTARPERRNAGESLRDTDVLAVHLGELHRREYGRILASLIRACRDFDLAEDALQEAFAAALAQWPAQGPPQYPVAWLLSTARHKAIDQLRRWALAESKRDDIAALGAPEEHAPVPLDALRLLFTCCHPALAPEAQVALTLRTICGLTTEEIARAFLVPAPTLAQRLVRAKAKIKGARIPYEVPGDDALADRLDTVIAVIYLVFNEGSAASFGAELVRADLCAEAIRPTRLLSAAGRTRGPAAPARPSRRSGHRLSAGIGAGHQRGRATIPRAAAGRGRRPGAVTGALQQATPISHEGALGPRSI